MDLKGLDDHDILGQMRVERIGQPVERDFGVCAEVRQIMLGMDPCIGPAAARDVDRMAHDHGHGFFHGLRNRHGVFLDLPAMIGGALIF